MKIKLFEGLDKEALEKEVNYWLTKNQPLCSSLEIVDIKLAYSESNEDGKTLVMVVYK